MLVPTNLASALLIVVLVVPGFVYGSVRAMFHGATSVRDTQLSSRIAGAVIVSIVFDAVYLILLGVIRPPVNWEEIASDPEGLVLRQPTTLGAVVLALGFVIPALCSVAAHLRVDWVAFASERAPAWLRKPVRRGGYRNFPSAWDRAAPGAGGTFVRVRIADNHWVGGWYSSGSSVSTYPHARDLFIEKQYNMRKDGSFGTPVEGSSGVWLAITDEYVVEWIRSTDANVKESAERGE